MLSAGLVNFFQPTDPKTDIQKPTCAEGEQVQTITNIFGTVTGYKCAPKPQTSGGPTWDEASKSWKCPTGTWHKSGTNCRLPDGQIVAVNRNDAGSCIPFGLSVSAVFSPGACPNSVLTREGFPIPVVTPPTPFPKRTWPKGTRYFFDPKLGAFRVFVPRGQVCPPGNVPTFAPCFKARFAVAAPTASNGVAVTQTDEATILQKGCPAGQMPVLVSKSAGYKCVPQTIQGALGWSFGQDAGLVEVEPEKTMPTGVDVVPAPQQELEPLPLPIGPMPGEHGGQVVPGAGMVDAHGCIAMIQQWCEASQRCITPAAGEKCEKPLYKQWWFWAIVAGGTAAVGTTGYFLLRRKRRFAS